MVVRFASLLLFVMVLLVTTTALSSNTWSHHGAGGDSGRAHRTARAAGIRIALASKLKGMGAFATQKISVGHYIGAYEGEVMTRKQVQARYWGKAEPTSSDKRWADSRRARGQSVTGHYVLEMKDGRFVDCEDAEYSSWCRFMNHAEEGTQKCNVKAFDRITVDGELEEFPQFYAIRDIEAGDELSWDYGPLFFKIRP